MAALTLKVSQVAMHDGGFDFLYQSSPRFSEKSHNLADFSHGSASKSTQIGEATANFSPFREVVVYRKTLITMSFTFFCKIRDIFFKAKR